MAIVRRCAPDADLGSVQALGGDLRSSSARVLTAIQWGIDQGVDVINCSFMNCWMIL